MDIYSGWTDGRVYIPVKNSWARLTQFLDFELKPVGDKYGDA